MEEITKAQFDTIITTLAFDRNDTTVRAVSLQDELERQGMLSARYSDLYARLGKYKLKMERQVKATRANIELEYREGARTKSNIVKMTDATIKACVESDLIVNAAEDLLIEITWWYNRAANYALAMNQRIDIMRMLQKEKSR